MIVPRGDRWRSLRGVHMGAGKGKACNCYWCWESAKDIDVPEDSLKFACFLAEVLTATYLH